MKRQGNYLPERISAYDADCGSVTAAVIGAGGIAAIPTETSYGLAVDPFNDDALERLYAVKKRPAVKPVLVLVDEVAGLTRLTSGAPDLYEPIITRFWPGPLTLIFPAQARLPGRLTAGTGTVGVRLSSNLTATEICRCAGGSITATSANISGRRAARSADEIAEQFGDLIDVVVDGGVLAHSPGSSIVGTDRGGLVSIREGAIPFATIVDTVNAAAIGSGGGT